MRVTFQLNGKPVGVEVEPRMHLADCLRDELRQTGTHLGCEHGVCGACTVIVDGAAVRSCLMLAVQAEGSTVVTVEGLSTDDALTPLQIAFRKHHALQCARHVDHRARPIDRGTGCRCRPHPLGALGQSVPMYRVHPDHRSGARRARCLPQD